MTYIRSNGIYIAIFAVIAILLFFGLRAYAAASEQFKTDCEAMGGHTDTKTQTSNTFGTHMGADGKMTTGNYTTSTTTTYCIGNNGEGILDFM